MRAWASLTKPAERVRNRVGELHGPVIHGSARRFIEVGTQMSRHAIQGVEARIREKASFGIRTPIGQHFENLSIT